MESWGERSTYAPPPRTVVLNRDVVHDVPSAYSISSDYLIVRLLHTSIIIATSPRAALLQASTSGDFRKILRANIA